MEENIKNLLLEDEEILWQGRPNQNLFTSADWFMIPSSMMTLAIFIVMRLVIMPTFMEVKPPIVFDVMFTLIIFMALYQFIIRFFVKSYVYKRTKYYVTNQRVLEVRNFSKTKAEKALISRIANCHLTMKDNGRSKVVFGDVPPFSFLMENTYAYPRFTYSASHKPPIGFYDLDQEDAQKVYNLVVKLKSQK